MITIDEEQLLERILLTVDPSDIDFYRKGESFLPDLYQAVTEDCITMSGIIKQAALDLLNEIFYQCRTVVDDDRLNAETIEESYVKRVFPYVYYCKRKEVRIASDDSYYIFSYVSALLSALDGVSDDVVRFASFIKAYIRRVKKEQFLQRAEAVVESIKQRKGMTYDFSPNPSFEVVMQEWNIRSICTWYLAGKQSTEMLLARFYSVEEQKALFEGIVDAAGYLCEPILKPSEIDEIRVNINAGKYLKASLHASSSPLAPPSPSKKLSDSEKLASPQAQQLWAQARRREWVDGDSKPLLPNTEAAFMADRMAQILGIRSKWKTFGVFWDMKPDSLRSAYNKALDKSTMLDFQDELKDAFHL